MSKVVLVLGTKKGLFTLTSNASRDKWTQGGPFLQPIAAHDFRGPPTSVQSTLMPALGSEWTLVVHQAIQQRPLCVDQRKPMFENSPHPIFERRILHHIGVFIGDVTRMLSIKKGGQQVLPTLEITVCDGAIDTISCRDTFHRHCLDAMFDNDVRRRIKQALASRFSRNSSSRH